LEESKGHTLIAFSSDGKKLAAAGGVVSKMSVWTLPERKKLEFKDEAFGWDAQAICFSPNGKLLAAGGEGYLEPVREVLLSPVFSRV
jgi:WD40 repeat protein